MNISYYDGLVGTIPDSYKQFMDLLKKLEGGVIHFNHTESDITTGRGVYKAKDTKAALLWDYIDAVAKECGLTGVSSEWGRIKANLDTINAKVNSNTIEWLEYLFYKEYYANVYIDKFPTALQPTIVSIKATTQVGCAKAIQFAIQNMHRLSPSLLGLNTDVKDPLTNKYYTYGTSYDSKYYQIRATLENPLSYNSNLINQTNVATTLQSKVL